MEVKVRILDAIGQKTEEIGDGSTGTASFGFRYPGTVPGLDLPLEVVPV